MTDIKKKVIKEKVKVKCELELFVKLGKDTEAMVVPGGVLIKHCGQLVHILGLKVLCLGEVNVLTKI